MSKVIEIIVKLNALASEWREAVEKRSAARGFALRNEQMQSLLRHYEWCGVVVEAKKTKTSNFLFFLSKMLLERGFLIFLIIFSLLNRHIP